MHNCQYCISHKCVESIEEIPKLKFTIKQRYTAI